MNPLRQQILEFLTTVPYGKVVSYKTIADKFGTHPRAVARYMATNKEPEKYPCCRVVAHDRWLWWYALGLEDKIRRLRLVGIEFENGKIAEKCMWDGKK